MNDDNTRQLAMRLAALAQEVERQNRASTQHLAQAAQELDVSMRQTRDALTSAIRDEAHAATAQGIAATVDAFSRSMQTVTQEARRIAEQLHAESRQLRHGLRIWTASAMATLAIGALLAAGGSSYVVWENRK